jgi:glutathionylspermidine synthase
VRRVPLAPRPDWKAKVEPLGFLFHTTGGTTPYWHEAAYYEFDEREITTLERATNDLHAMCLEAVQHVIDRDRFADLKIPPYAVDAIVKTWDEDPPAIYGRFDLAYDGHTPPKLLEYNADTPTALLEAAVIQWHWLQECFPDADQFNSIWEGLVAKWRALADEGVLKGDMVVFAHEDELEDLMTVTLLRDTAREAGVITKGIHMQEMGWDDGRKVFVDLQEYPLECVFKLYPWEWLISDAFGPHVLSTLDKTQWIEPIWKMVLSNKAILAILWEMYPGHPT